MKSLFSLALMGALATSWNVCAQSASDYPNKPIRMIIGTAPGGAADSVARILSDGLTKVLGQPLVPENMPGAVGQLAAQATIRSKPDGYTVLFYWDDLLILTPWTQKTPPYDPLGDFVQLGELTRTRGLFLAVPGTSPVNTFEDLQSLRKALRSS